MDNIVPEIEIGVRVRIHSDRLRETFKSLLQFIAANVGDLVSTRFASFSIDGDWTDAILAVNFGTAIEIRESAPVSRNALKIVSLLIEKYDTLDASFIAVEDIDKAAASVAAQFESRTLIT
jgi:hypothetical protein